MDWGKKWFYCARPLSRNFLFVSYTLPSIRETDFERIWVLHFQANILGMKMQINEMNIWKEAIWSLLYALGSIKTSEIDFLVWFCKVNVIQIINFQLCIGSGTIFRPVNEYVSRCHNQFDTDTTIHFLLFSKLNFQFIPFSVPRQYFGMKFNFILSIQSLFRYFQPLQSIPVPSELELCKIPKCHFRIESIGSDYIRRKAFHHSSHTPLKSWIWPCI